MEQATEATTPEATTVKEAYINSSKDAIQVLANLRAMGKQGEMGGAVPPDFASRVVNDLYDVMMWIEANIREDVTTEAKKPDFLDIDKDGDKEEPMAKAAKDKSHKKVDEAMVIQADGSEAMALLGILKLAGMPAPQPAAEERDVELANTPSEHEFPHGSAVPSGTDLHKQKGAYRSAAGGDNAMAVEELNQLEGKLKGMFESMVAAGE
jgi:hypothetical protein